jgi:hypothetical protein
MKKTNLFINKMLCWTKLSLFLDEFAKFRKATISFVMSLRLSLPVRHTELGFHLTDFH